MNDPRWTWRDYPVVPLLVIAAFVGVAVLAAEDVGTGPAPIKVRADQRLGFGFDWDGLDRDGNQHAGTITEIIFRFTVPGGEPVAWKRLTPTAPVIAGQVVVPYSEVLRNIPAGLYNLNVKLLDSQGLEGNYSAPLLIEVEAVPDRGKAPSTPTNLRGPVALPEEP